MLRFITNGLPGLPEAIRRAYPQAEGRRSAARYGPGDLRPLAEDLRRVYGMESRGML